MDHNARQPLHTRLRWGNVARAGAVVALAATIIAWPRLTPREPALPPVDPVPVAPMTIHPNPAPEQRRERERPVVRKREPKATRPRTEAHERGRPLEPVAPATAITAPVPARAAPAPTPAAAPRAAPAPEFRPAGGEAPGFSLG